jgi:hypothetical protein
MPTIISALGDDTYKISITFLIRRPSEAFAIMDMITVLPVQMVAINLAH